MPNIQAAILPAPLLPKTFWHRGRPASLYACEVDPLMPMLQAANYLVLKDVMHLCMQVPVPNLALVLCASVRLGACLCIRACRHTAMHLAFVHLCVYDFKGFRAFVHA
eukprot:1157014-Pelagomonas_calceolata.AAC.3